MGLSVIILGKPSHMPYTVKCAHEKAYIGMNHVIPMLVLSYFFIVGGGLLDPEAPLVAIYTVFGGVFPGPSSNR